MTMDYGIPLGLGLLGLAIIAFVLWEMFRRQPPACELAWKERELSAADKARNEEMLEFRAYRPDETATQVIDLPQGKTLDEVPVLWCDTPEGQKVIRERVVARRSRAVAEDYFGGKNMREMG